MKELHELKDKLMDELKDYGRKDMSGSNLEVIDKLTHTIKNLCKIIDEEGYSNSYPYSYDDRSMRGSYRYSRDGYTRDGYSRHDLSDKLRDLMNEAPDDRTKMEIKRLIEKM